MVGLKWGVKSNRWFKYENPLHTSSEDTGMSHNLPAWKLGGRGVATIVTSENCCKGETECPEETLLLALKLLTDYNTLNCKASITTLLTSQGYSEARK